MFHIRLVALAMLSCAVAPLALAQSLEDFEPECVRACLVGFEEPAADCDCEAIDAAAEASEAPGSAAGGSSGGSSLNRLPTARDLVLEAEADYNARMASVDNYYFVETTVLAVPAGAMPPGTAQAPVVTLVMFQAPAAAPGGNQGPAELPMMPGVRYFEPKLGAAGKKIFKELSPPELAERDPLNPPLAGIMGNLRGALGALAGGMPNTGAGGFAGALAGRLASKLENLQISFGGKGDDGYGMALEEELIADFEGDRDIPVYLGWYIPQGGGRSLFQLDRVRDACISLSCGARFENVVRRYRQILRNRRLSSVPSTMRGVYVIRLDGSDRSHDITSEGKTYMLRTAELWLMDASDDYDFTDEGPSKNELVPIRRRMEYETLGANGFQRVVIDRITEGYERYPFLAPRKGTTIMEGLAGSPAMKMMQFFSQKKLNEDAPTQEEIARMIARARELGYSDPLTDDTVLTSGPRSDAQDAAAPADREPLLIEGQGTPPVRDPAVPVPRTPDD